MKKNKKDNKILDQEAIKVAIEVAEILAKSSKLAKAEDKEEDEKEDKEKEAPKSEGMEKPETEKPEGLEKNEDGIEGEVPESVEESPESSSIDLKGMSPEQILALAAQALDELEARGVLPERSQEDADAAEHELNEIKEDMAPAAAPEMAPSAEAEPEMEKVANMAPPVPAIDPAASANLPQPADAAPVAPMAMSLEDVLGKKDLSQLESLCAALNNHIAARKEMEKTSHAAPAAMNQAVPNAMAKSMVSDIVKEVKASLLESLKKETAELKKSVKGVEDLVKSHRAAMATPSNTVVVATSAAPESNELTKSNTESIGQELETADDSVRLETEKALALAKINTLQKSHKGAKVPFYDYLIKVKKAPDTLEIVKALNDLDAKISR
jgi:hypothetical protein